MDASKSILIIDHEVDLYTDLLALFQRFHYSCSFAQNGLSALTALKTGSFDLVILELRLLDVEGNCLFSMFRRLYPNLPVLILTRDDSKESMYRALHYGACGYLQKPVDPRQVLFCVNEIFREPALVKKKALLQAKRPARKARSRPVVPDEAIW